MSECSMQRLAREYRRLTSLFSVSFTVFERKRYENLAHEPNKAMNLNSYLALLGGRFSEIKRGANWFLVPAGEAPASLTVPAAEFVITLDADSVLMPEYALRLVHKMCLPGNECLAVAQTPYSSIPAARGSLEYVAGATTYIQDRPPSRTPSHRSTSSNAAGPCITIPSDWLTARRHRISGRC